MNDEQLMRYSRHILLPQVDIDGQEKLYSSTILIVGLGGLGSPAALYLAAAGVGELVLCDFDRVELSNLQRQVIHTEQSVGEFKVASAIARLKQLNSDCKLLGITEPITQKTLAEPIQSVDLVLDCSDNLQTRLDVNQVCVKFKTPLVSAAAIRMEGQVAVFQNQGGGPCYQCLYSNPDEKQLSCSEAGVLSTTVGIIGTLQAQEAIKTLLNLSNDSNNLSNKKDGELLLFDGMNNDLRKIQIKKNSECPACGEQSSKI